MDKTPRTPGAVVVSAREYVEALERLKRSEARLKEAQENLTSSELIARNCRKRFIEVAAAYGVDDGGDPPAAARAIWPRAQSTPQPHCQARLG